MEAEKKFFYTNGMEVAVSGYDLSINFLRQGGVATKGQKLGDAPQIATIVELDRMVVSMSISHAKSMLAALFAAVENFEKEIGPIPLQKPAQTAYENAIAQIKKSK